jgi:putative SOS response-associated peptidase YedK
MVVPMCGRYTSTSRIEDLANVFAVEEVRADPLPARYNVAPTHDVYAIAVRGSRDPERGPHRALGTFRWGLVPTWAKDPSVGSRMINARAEGIATKPAYRQALARRRCIIPADAFYEWQRRADSWGRSAGKLPYAIRRRDGDPMAFAGLWEVWWPEEARAAPGGPEVRRDDGARRPDAVGEPLRTCAIVTTSANDLVAPIHDRMPVVLARPDWDAWLDPQSDLEQVVGLLVPAPSDWFDAYPVSSLVNNVANDGPELIEPIPPPPGSDLDRLPGVDGLPAAEHL